MENKDDFDGGLVKNKDDYKVGFVETKKTNNST